MPILHLRHLTSYHYRKPVGVGEHRFMLRPKDALDQQVVSFEVAITPTLAELRQVHDVFGNPVGVARFAGLSDVISFESSVVIDHRPSQVVDDEAEAVRMIGGVVSPFVYDPDNLPDLACASARHHGEDALAVDAWVRRFARRGRATPLLGMLTRMTQSVRSDFTYAKRFDGLIQAPAATLASRSGTCRDYAVLMMEAARGLGLAARFVSGYVYCPRRPGETGRRGGGHTHAWLQVFLPSSGWVDLDPTNGIVGNRDLVRVATVRAPGQAVPVAGSWNGDASDFVKMTVEVELQDSEATSIAA